MTGKTHKRPQSKNLLYTKNSDAMDIHVINNLYALVGKGSSFLMFNVLKLAHTSTITPNQSSALYWVLVITTSLKIGAIKVIRITITTMAAVNSTFTI